MDTLQSVRPEHRVEIGDRAPSFVLPSHTGEMVSLEELIGERPLVLYFYPKDYTPGCTAEACGFRDSYEDFIEAGAVVVGVSSDTPKSHQGFIAKHDLPYTLLSDESGEVRRLYGYSPTLGILPKRVTFVIDKEGVVRHIFSSLTKAEQHVEEALRVVRELSGS